MLHGCARQCRKEALAEPKGASGGPPNTTTLAMVGIGRGGKQVYESQAEVLGLCSADTTPKKAKLPNLWEPNQRPLPHTLLHHKTLTTGMPLTCLPATHLTEPMHPQEEPNLLKDPLRWVRLHVACYWGNTNGTSPLWATEV